jgi:hypothetical protein
MAMDPGWKVPNHCSFPLVTEQKSAPQLVPKIASVRFPEVSNVSEPVFAVV